MGCIVPQVGDTFDEFDGFCIGENSVQSSVLRLQRCKKALVSCPHIPLGYSELEALIHKHCKMVKPAKDQRVIEIQVVTYLKGVFLTCPLGTQRGHLLYFVEQK